MTESLFWANELIIQPCDPAQAYSGVVLLIEIPSAEER